MLHHKTMAAITAHALAEYPRECCGLIVARGSDKELYVPCRNIAATPSEHFRMHPEDWADAEDAYGEPQMLVHSHPDASAEPSDADRASCEESGIPWFIVAVSATEATGQHLLQPTGWKAPLLARPFYHGILDCYTLVQDFYSRELDIELPTPERDDGWWNTGGNLYMDNYESAGFRLLRPGEPIAYGDVVLMAVQSPVANHAGVFMGDNGLREKPGLHKVPDAIIHHLYGRLSQRDVYGGYWAEVTRAILRHKTMDK